MATARSLWGLDGKQRGLHEMYEAGARVLRRVSRKERV